MTAASALSRYQERILLARRLSILLSCLLDTRPPRGPFAIFARLASAKKFAFRISLCVKKVMNQGFGAFTKPLTSYIRSAATRQ